MLSSRSFLLLILVCLEITIVLFIVFFLGKQNCAKVSKMQVQVNCLKELYHILFSSREAAMLPTNQQSELLMAYNWFHESSIMFVCTQRETIIICWCKGSSREKLKCRVRFVSLDVCRLGVSWGLISCKQHQYCSRLKQIISSALYNMELLELGLLVSLKLERGNLNQCC